MRLDVGARVGRYEIQAKLGGGGKTALAISGRHHWAVAALGAIYADWGKMTEAQAMRDELVARAAREYVSPGALAWAVAAAGDPDAALALIRRAYEERDPFLWFSVRLPSGAQMRAVPGVQDIMRRLNMPDQ